MRQLTPKEAKRLAQNATDDLSAYISPSDVTDKAEKWSDIEPDTLGRELHQCINVMVSEGQNPYKGLIRDLSLTLWQEGMPRVSLEKLATDDPEKAVLEWGIWPNKIDKWQCREWLESNPEVVTSDVRQRATETVEMGIKDGLNPLEQ